MRVGLVGFGRTGKSVADECLRDPECSLTWVLKKSRQHAGDFVGVMRGFDSHEGEIFSLADIKPESFFREHPVDIILDFAGPEAIHTYRAGAKDGIRVVSAVSDYEQAYLDELRELSQHTAVLHSPNITLGINLLLKACQLLQKAMPSVSISIVEEHFSEKSGVSGTALHMAEVLAVDQEKEVHSVRVGETLSKHQVLFGFPHQMIRLTHEVVTRDAFGHGALFCARQLLAKPNGLYSMEEFFTTP